MHHSTLKIIRAEHAALSTMLYSMGLMLDRGPGHDAQQYFDVMRSMLFYIDEFPERVHHPKESELLFPLVGSRVPEVRQDLERLNEDHDRSENAVRELQHMLLAWELLGDSRRSQFEAEARKYLQAYSEHMRLEESTILPAAERVLTPEEWSKLDAAFASNRDPLTASYPHDPLYDKLLSRIVTRAPEPVGVGSN